ncbi:MAG: 2-dehydro-3-deoxygalactonokinase [Pirellulales bacterium]|nr:2-dehydro-3-deoxygalactonokinase [Pirellulales bacterium]
MNGYFINCDWGTTRFRLRLIDTATGDMLARLRNDDGAAALALRAYGEDRATLFRDTLQGHMQTLATRAEMDLSRIPIVISGMASSSIGWRELPYAKLPFALDAKDAIWHNLNDTGKPGGVHAAGVFLFSGLRSDKDVLRGEETQVIGVAQLPQVAPLMDDVLILLPGTHSKHVQVVDHRITDFHTHMTGELYHTLRHHGSLQHSTGSSAFQEDEPLLLTGPIRESFCEGLDESTKAPLSANLFRVRSRQLLDDCEASSNSAFLSGLLIGSEVQSLRHQWPDEKPLVLCAGQRLCELYEIALKTLCPKSSVTIIPPSDVSRLSALGQSVAFQHIFNTTAGGADGPVIDGSVVDVPT